MPDWLAMSQQRNRNSGRGTQRDTVVVTDVPSQRDARSARTRATQRATVTVNALPPPRLRAVLTAGAATSAWNAAVVLLPILVVVIATWWMVGRPGAVSDVTRTVGAIWLVGHGASIDVSGLPVGLPPLVLTAIIVWRLSKAGANTVRALQSRTVPAARAATLAVTMWYVLFALLVAVLVDGDVYDLSIWKTVAWVAAVAVLSCGVGAMNEAGALDDVWLGLPTWLRRGIRTGTLSMIAVTACGALGVGAALALRGSAVVETFSAYDGAALGLVLLSVLYLPTTAIWAAAYLLGPGFAVGVDTQVSVMTVDIMPMPVFPLFAAVPHAPLDTWGTALWAVPLVIGCVQGIALGLRSVDSRWATMTWSVLAAGLTAGVLMAGMAFMASGSLGTQRLSQLGPDVVQSGASAAISIAGSVLCGAVAARLFGRGRRDRA